MELRRRDILAAGALAAAGPAALAETPTGLTAPSAVARMITSRYGVRTQAFINGIPVMALLDSGATEHSIDIAAAARLGLTASGTPIHSLGISGVARGRISDAAMLTFAGHDFANSRLAMLDLSKISKTAGEPVELLLGRPLFRALVVETDFRDRTITVHNPNLYKPPANASLVPLSGFNGLMTAPLTLPGGLIYATVDTGSMAPLVVSPAAARRINLPGTNMSSTTLLSGLSGVSEGAITSAPTVQLGPVTFKDVPICIPSTPIGTDGNIGLGVLSRFNLSLDFGNSRMWVTPLSVERPFDHDLLGLYGVPGPEGVQVSHIAAGSPADHAGLMQGDVIRTINGQPAIGVNVQIVSAEPGFRMTFVLANGERREAVLARYY